MRAALSPQASLVSASTLIAPARQAAWSVPDLAGQLVELSAHGATACLTAAFGLVLEAQLAGDQAAWVTLGHSTFFPPDVTAGGVDIEALPVVRVPDALGAGRAPRTSGRGPLITKKAVPPPRRFGTSMFTRKRTGRLRSVANRRFSPYSPAT